MKRRISLIKAGCLILTALLWGCGGSHGDKYIEPTDATAHIIVHVLNEEWDLFLDGKHLGCISWDQAYAVSPGEHVLLAKSSRHDIKNWVRFAIREGQTIQFRVHTGKSEFFRDATSFKLDVLTPSGWTPAWQYRIDWDVQSELPEP